MDKENEMKTWLDVLNEIDTFNYSDTILWAKKVWKNIIVEMLISWNYLEDIKQWKLTAVLILMDREKLKSL